MTKVTDSCAQNQSVTHVTDSCVQIQNVTLVTENCAQIQRVTHVTDSCAQFQSVTLVTDNCVGKIAADLVQPVAKTREGGGGGGEGEGGGGLPRFYGLKLKFLNPLLGKKYLSSCLPVAHLN